MVTLLVWRHGAKSRSCRVTSEGRPASQSRRPRRPSRDRFARTGEDVAVATDAAQRRPTAHEHQMTDQPNSTSDEETPAGDPELAALVRPHAPPDDTDASDASDASTPAGDPELAALVRHNEPPFDADTAL